MKVEGTVETLSGNHSAAHLIYEGPTEIPSRGPNDPFVVNVHYLGVGSFPFGPGQLMKYVIRVHNGGTSVDTATSEFGIHCIDL